jgi:hypothetical protein
VKKSTRPYPLVRVDTTSVGAVAHAGGVLLTRTAYATGLSGALCDGLLRWRKPLAVHDPAKVLTNLALSLVLGGDALCDAALLRAEPGLYGLVGSEATISRTITTLAEDAEESLKAALRPDPWVISWLSARAGVGSSRRVRAWPGRSSWGLREVLRGWLEGAGLRKVAERAGGGGSEDGSPVRRCGRS